MNTLNPVTFFTDYYFLKPFSKKLNETEKKVAFIATIALGILTAGLLHLIGSGFWMARNISHVRSPKSGLLDHVKPQKTDNFPKNKKEISETNLSATTPQHNEISFSKNNATELPNLHLDEFLHSLGIDSPVDHSVHILDGGHILIEFDLEKDSFWPEKLHVTDEGLVIPIQHCHQFIDHSSLKKICEASESFSKLYLSQFKPADELDFLPVIPPERGDKLLKNPGDYFISKSGLNKNGERCITIRYLDYKKECKEFEILYPQYQHYWKYQNVLEHLLCPVGCKTEKEKSEILMALQGYRFCSIRNVLEEDSEEKIGRDFQDKKIGILSNFLEWTTAYGYPKNSCFNPSYFLNLIGHQFGLKGTYSYSLPGFTHYGNYQYSLNLEGTSTAIAIRELCEQAHLFLPRAKINAEYKRRLQLTTNLMYEFYQAAGCWSDEKVETVQKTICKQFRKGVPISIPSGWEGHAVNIVITNNYICYTNKGQRTDGKPGRTIYRIGQPDQAEEFIKKLLSLKKGSQEEMESFFTQTMIEDLKLEKVGFIEGKDQKVGNCTFASNKSFLSMAALLLGLEDGGNLEELQSSALKLHSEFSFHQRLYWLKRLNAMITTVNWPLSTLMVLHFIASLCILKVCYKPNKEEEIFDSDINKVISDLENHPPFLKQFIPLIRANKIVEALQLVEEAYADDFFRQFVFQPFVWNLFPPFFWNLLLGIR